MKHYIVILGDGAMQFCCVGSDSQLLQISHNIRRNGRREARLMPLIRHLWRAAGSAKGAEMTQVQRIAPVMPPLCILGCRCCGCEGVIR
jgi:hypothetical protein